MELIRYVAPDGLGDGISRDNPSNLAAALSWAKSSIDQGSIHITLLPGVYIDYLDLSEAGSADNTLIIEGESPNGVIFLSVSTQDLSHGTVRIYKCHNITIRHLHFRQPDRPALPNTEQSKYPYRLVVDNSSSVTIDRCTFHDLETYYGLLGVHHSKSRQVSIVGCTFARSWGMDPTGSGNHMIYIAYETEQVHVINCTFSDNYGGSYVKIRDGIKDSSVIGCTFIRSNQGSHGYSLAAKQMILVTRIGDDEIPCNGITMNQNKFINLTPGESWACYATSGMKNVVYHSNASIGNVRFVNDFGSREVPTGAHNAVRKYKASVRGFLVLTNGGPDFGSALVELFVDPDEKRPPSLRTIFKEGTPPAERANARTLPIRDGQEFTIKVSSQANTRLWFFPTEPVTGDYFVEVAT